MNLDLLLKLVREPGAVEADNQADLEALVLEYPYFTAAHLLLLKLYKQQNSIHFNKQLRKVASLAPSREHVYDLVEVLPNLDEEPAQETSEQVLTTVAPTVAASEPVVEVLKEQAAAESTTDLLEVATTEVPTSIIDVAETAGVEHPPLAEKAVISDETPIRNEAVDQLVEVDEPSEVVSPLVEEVDNTAQQETAMAEAMAEALPEVLEISLVGDELSEEEPQSQSTDTSAEVEQFTMPLEENPEEQTVESTVAPLVSMAHTLTTEAASDSAVDFIKSAHDRLSWFRYFSGKPLREQPDDVLEQLYMEHMQQDLLMAPDTTPATSIKAKVNLAEEVESSVSMEEEIKRLAYDSISDDELPASETLARIYEQQNEYKRAIKIYQKLILKFPDKMTYFAGLIEELRKKV